MQVWRAICAGTWSDSIMHESCLRSAIGIFGFGGPDVLEMTRVPAREPAYGEVRIKVAAAAVNPIDILMRSGAAPRLFEALPVPHILGYDAAGTIDEVGPGVNRLSAGDQVMAVVSPLRLSGGAYQDSLIVKAASVVPVPDGASMEQASTLPMNGLTALAAFRELDVAEGGRLLITGGAGWLATLVLGIARTRGLWTIADAHPGDHKTVLDAGADCVIERGADLAQRIRRIVPEGVDAALDTARIGPSILPAIRDGGVCAVVRLDANLSTARGISIRGVSMMPMIEDTEALLVVRDLAWRRNIPMRVLRTFPADKAREAHMAHQRGGIRGRVVIRF